MISKKLQIAANTDAIGDLQRRVSELEHEIDSLKYELRCEIKSSISAYMKEGIGYIILERDKDQIIAQIKDNISECLKHLNIK